jgi:hypothetical protein
VSKGFVLPPPVSSAVPAKLSGDDRELIQVLFDDVGLIEGRLPAGSLLRPPEIRATLSPLLRKWIGERQFHKAQKLLRPQMVRFQIVSQAQAIKYCQAGIFEHWMGYMLFGTLGISTGKTAERYTEKGRPNKYALPPVGAAAAQVANPFFDQKMFYWKGEFYTRSDVVKWLANKFGGTHLDFRRRDDEAHINEIKDYFGFEVETDDRGRLVGSKMLIGQEISLGRADPLRRSNIYDAADLIALDTARIFAEGVRASEKDFARLLE